LSYLSLLRYEADVMNPATLVRARRPVGRRKTEARTGAMISRR